MRCFKNWHKAIPAALAARNRFFSGLVLSTALILPAAAQTVYKTDVAFGLVSQKDPHPLTYTFGADIKPVTEPGPMFYYFYYAGTVQPDARVLPDDKVQRIPIAMNEWDVEKKYLVAKLTYFYQVTHNLPPTALNELQPQSEVPASPELGGAPPPQSNALPPPAGGLPPPADLNAVPPPAPVPTASEVSAFPPPPPAQGEVAPPAPNFGQPAAPFGMMGGPPMMPGPGFSVPQAPNYAGYQFNQPNMNFSSNANLDPRAAAEWTLYLDQFVLWQYYCARNLLHDKQDTLLDQSTGGPSGQPPVLSAAGQAAMSKQLSVLAQPGSASGGPGGAGAGRSGAGGGGVGGVGTFIDNSTGDFYGQRGAASTAPGFGGPFGGAPGAPGVATVRETFILANMKQTGVDYRDKFFDAAKANEQKLYKLYAEMVNRIDQRAENQEKYEEWIQNKRQNIVDFADNWRKLDEGEAQVIGDTMFLVTQEPLEAVPYDAINLEKRERVTPQDMINRNGTIMQPEVR